MDYLPKPKISYKTSSWSITDEVHNIDEINKKIEMLKLQKEKEDTKKLKQLKLYGKKYKINI